MRSGCAIIGTGAVGSALGWLLERAGTSCHYWGRKGPIRYQTSMTFRGEASKMDFPLPVPGFEPQAVFVTVKAYDVHKALGHQFFLNKKIPIIILCNGIIEDEVRGLKEEFRENLWRRGVVLAGVKRLEAGWELIGEKREVVWGPVEKGVKPTQFEQDILRALGDQGWRWVDDMTPVVHKKWLFNTCLNSLCAFYKLPTNKAVLGHEADLKIIFNESYELGRELWGEWAQSKEQIYGELTNLIHNTNDNENSMARDSRLGRPTENRFLAGLVLKSKKSYPLLRTVYTVIEKAPS